MKVITFDQKLVEYCNSWNPGGWPVGNMLLCIAALVLCVVLVGVVGIEREKKGRSAGLRTHLLVGIGSTILMIISIYGFPLIGDGNSVWNRDVARLVAQVVSGVGFLGAGAIMHRNSGVKGLTTAGTIWVSMAIGIACGSFNFLIAFVGTAVLLLVLIFFKRVEQKIAKSNPTILLIAPADTPILDKILVVSKEFDCTVHGVSTSLVEEEGQRRIEVTFQAIFDSGEERIHEYVSRVEQETHATHIHIEGHK